MEITQQILQQLINGISLGSIYALIALGYTMIYGIIKLINFAHGDIYMVGAYIGFFAITQAHLSIIPALIISFAVTGVLGMIVEKLAYKPLRSASSLAVLITAIGVSYLLQSLAQIIWSSSKKSFTVDLSFANVSLFGGQLKIDGVAVCAIAACIVIMVLLSLFISKTKTGKAMRAVSEDKNAAELMGISVNRTISVTFAIGSALAAIAGLLFCAKTSTLSPTTGSLPGIKAFTAAVFGGIGSIPGALIGGVLLGVIEIFSAEYISDQLQSAVVFAVLIIILLVKPNGLLGKKVTEKV